MNGTTKIDAGLNPCSAMVDMHTYGWSGFNVCMCGRLIKVCAWRLTVDVYRGWGRPFAAMAGGAPGIDRYWTLFWPLGKIQWITNKAAPAGAEERKEVEGE